jgi:hypothetical protein
VHDPTKALRQFANTLDTIAFAMGIIRLMAPGTEQFKAQCNKLFDARRLLDDLASRVLAHLIATPNETGTEWMFRVLELADRAYHFAIEAAHSSLPGTRDDATRNRDYETICDGLQQASAYLHRVAVLLPSDVPTIPKLNERKYTILQAMLELRATTFQDRATTEKIAAKAEGANASPEQFKHPMSDLKKRNLVHSHGGRHGGYWLTDDGRAVAEHLTNSGDAKR